MEGVMWFIVGFAFGTVAGFWFGARWMSQYIVKQDKIMQDKKKAYLGRLFRNINGGDHG